MIQVISAAIEAIDLYSALVLDLATVGFLLLFFLTPRNAIKT